MPRKITPKVEKKLAEWGERLYEIAHEIDSTVNDDEFAGKRMALAAVIGDIEKAIEALNINAPEAK